MIASYDMFAITGMQPQPINCDMNYLRNKGNEHRKVIYNIRFIRF